MDKSYSPRDIEPRIYAAWEAAGWFAPAGDGDALLHHDSAAERDRHAAHGPRVPAHAHGHADALPSHGGRPHAVATRHRPRGHRDADGRRAPAERRSARSRQDTRPRSLRRARLGMEGRIRRHDLAPDAPARQFGRLVARPLHDGRGPLRGSARSVRAPARGRPDLSRPAARELGSGAAHRALRPRGRLGAGSRATCGTCAIRSRTARGTSSSRRRGRRRCSATPRWRCIPTTSATGIWSVNRFACR